MAAQKAGPDAVPEALIEPEAPADTVPTEAPAEDTPTDGERVEEYDARRPDGTTVRVWHNLETGETRIVG